MEHIAVSVIVPIYNAEPWLEECVQSILDQDFPASYGTIEVLLIDDGATDGSGALCDRLAKRDNRIKVVHQENQGLSGARNTGIDMARGRYYAFIDSDDVVRPAYLKRCTKPAKRTTPTWRSAQWRTYRRTASPCRSRYLPLPRRKVCSAARIC